MAECLEDVEDGISLLLRVVECGDFIEFEDTGDAVVLDVDICRMVNS